MKRSVLLRRTPLRTRTRLTRTPIKPKGRPVSAWEHQRPHLTRRSDACCECCGAPITAGFEIHHRRLRSRGGDHTLTNLLALCSRCHQWVHHQPREATRLGLMVASWNDPAETPLILPNGQQVFLQPDGTYWPATSPWINNQPTESDNR